MAMLNDPARSTRKYPCESCPLRSRKSFRDFSGEELAFVSSFKRGELSVDRGATVLCEGTRTPHLFTVLEGWGFRYKLMADGRRQIVNYIMPGDLIGLQATFMDEMQHSIEALSPMTLCVFERDRLMSLYRGYPELACDITWLVAFLAARARASGLVAEKAPLTMAITQQHMADTLGLSLVHTNKTARKLAQRKLLRWRDGGCEVLDAEGLAALAGWENQEARPRAFI
jgi:CRP-like cAMP-binding protein